MLDDPRLDVDQARVRRRRRAGRIPAAELTELGRRTRAAVPSSAGRSESVGSRTSASTVPSSATATPEVLVAPMSRPIRASSLATRLRGEQPRVRRPYVGCEVPRVQIRGAVRAGRPRPAPLDDDVAAPASRSSASLSRSVRVAHLQHQRTTCPSRRSTAAGRRRRREVGREAPRHRRRRRCRHAVSIRATRAPARSGRSPSIGSAVRGPVGCGLVDVAGLGRVGPDARSRARARGISQPLLGAAARRRPRRRSRPGPPAPARRSLSGPRHRRSAPAISASTAASGMPATGRTHPPCRGRR